MKKGVAAILLFLLLAFAVSGDDLEDILRFLSDKVMSVQIKLRLLDQDEEITWDAESTRITVVGRAINIRLVGPSVVIDSYITPFGDIDENLVLVANGEIWFASEAEDEGTRYESFIKSLPVVRGESIIFFPLGVAVDSDTNIYTIQLEIKLLSYKEYLEQAE